MAGGEAGVDRAIEILSGQVELGRSRPQPPRRVEAKVDIKA